MLKGLLNLQIHYLETLHLGEAYKIESLIKRAISRQEFSDFYALDAISPYFEGGAQLPEGLSPEIRKKIDSLLLRRNKLVWDIANYYANSMHKVMIKEYGEGEPKWPGKKSLMDYDYDDEQQKDKKLKQRTLAEQNLEAAGIPEQDYYSDVVKNFSPSQIIAGFRYLKWPSAFGGEPWAKIAELYKELREEIGSLKNYIGDHQVIRWHMDGTFRQKLSKLVQLIDRINQAEHNTGSLFTHFEGGESNWITDALNEKAIPSSLKLLKTRTSPDIGGVINELDQEQFMDELDLGGQIAEVQLSRSMNKKKDKLKINYQRRLDELTDNLKGGYYDQKAYDYRKKIIDEEYDRDVKKLENPFSDQNIAYLVEMSSVKPLHLLGLLLRNEESLKNNFEQLSYKLNFWSLPANVLRRIASMPDMRQRIIKTLLDQAHDGLQSFGDKIDERTATLVWGMFNNSPLRTFASPRILYALRIFRMFGLDTSRYGNIEKQMQEDPYAHMDRPEIFEDKQMELFSSFDPKIVARLMRRLNKIAMDYNKPDDSWATEYPGKFVVRMLTEHGTHIDSVYDAMFPLGIAMDAEYKYQNNISPQFVVKRKPIFISTAEGDVVYSRHQIEYKYEILKKKAEKDGLTIAEQIVKMYGIIPSAIMSKKIRPTD